MGKSSIHKASDQGRAALQFIFLFGIVSLFGDITYEGVRSVAGPYLAALGASAGVVGLVAGLGEFIGYALRLVSGYFADRTGRYWLFTIVGYGMLFFIPLLAVAGCWQLAAFFIILERMGKAIRTPARDAMISHATQKVGRGWGFGIHEALDQVGAITGPLIFSAAFLLGGGYREGFTALWVPATLTFITLVVARLKFPSPEKFETPLEKTGRGGESGRSGLPKTFWFYALFVFLSVAGFVNFQLVSYHFKIQSVIPEVQIPLFYAIAMGVDALAALIVGKVYDRIGIVLLVTVPFLTLPIPLLAFSHSYRLALASALLWGIVMGIHETIMRAAIADLAPVNRRGIAYGIFNTVYGTSWFLGSMLMGLLYNISISYIILFTIAVEAISVPLLFLLMRSRVGVDARQ